MPMFMMHAVLISIALVRPLLQTKGELLSSATTQAPLVQGSTLAAVSPGFARLEALVQDFDEEFVTATELAAAAAHATTGAATDQLQSSNTAAPLEPPPPDEGGLSDASCSGLEAQYPGLISIYVSTIVFKEANITGNFTCLAGWRQVLGSDAVWLRGTVGTDAYAVQLSRKMWRNEFGVEEKAVDFFPQEDPKTGEVNPLTSGQVLQNQWSVRDLKKVGTGGDEFAGVPVEVWNGAKAKAKAGGWTAQMLPEHVFATKEEMAARTNGYIPPTAEELAAFTKPGPMMDELQQTPTIPDTFDGQREFAGCVSLPIVNQGNCGSCWAFASAKAFSTGLCHFSQQRVNINLAENDLVNCGVKAGPYYVKAKDGGHVVEDTNYAEWSTRFNGCDGGNAIDAAAGIAISNGLKVRECSPYTYGDEGAAESWTNMLCKAEYKCSAGYDYNIVPPFSTTPEVYRYQSVKGIQTGFMLFGNPIHPRASLRLSTA
jgi:hypothetical protein